MIDIRKYLEDNHIELPKEVSMEEFIEVVKFHIPFAYDAFEENDFVEENVVRLSIMVVQQYYNKKNDTRIKH